MPDAWPEEAVRDLGLEASSPDRIALEEADFIVSGGNGMRDMETFNALADALGAVTGASRVAVDDGRFVRAKQIGATGKTVQASVYLALGISGAVQHLQGIKDCRHVIAVNLDESAPIARRANLTLVEDSRALMRALLQLVTQARQSNGTMS
jgi:electron transfer flavoprotein alpha subunit